MKEPEALLLKHLLDLFKLAPDFKNWNEQAFQKSAPRLQRLKAIHSLLNALNLTINITEFSKGLFIKDYSSQIQNQLCLSLLSTSLNSINSDFPKERMEKELQYSFERIFAYRCQIETLLAINDGIYATNPIIEAVSRVISVSQNNIISGIQELDELLLQFLNPHKQQLTMESLAKDYGYPTIDFDVLDIEWM